MLYHIFKEKQYERAKKLKSTVLKLYSAGSKVADIVTQTGVPRSTVYYWVKNGIPKESSTLNLRDYHFLKQKCERQENIIAILKSAPCAATAPLQERLAAIEQMASYEGGDWFEHAVGIKKTIKRWSFLFRGQNDNLKIDSF